MWSIWPPPVRWWQQKSGWFYFPDERQYLRRAFLLEPIRCSVSWASSILERLAPWWTLTHAFRSDSVSPRCSNRAKNSTRPAPFLNITEKRKQGRTARSINQFTGVPDFFWHLCLVINLFLKVSGDQRKSLQSSLPLMFFSPKECSLCYSS